MGRRKHYAATTAPTVAAGGTTTTARRWGRHNCCWRHYHCRAGGSTAAAGGTTAAPGATTAPCANSARQNPPGSGLPIPTPVVLDRCPTVWGRRTLVLNLGVDDKMFNLQAWLTTYAQRRKCDRATLKVCNLAEGSVIIDLNANDADQDALLRDAGNSVTTCRPSLTRARGRWLRLAAAGSTRARLSESSSAALYSSWPWWRQKMKHQRTSIAYLEMK